MDNKISLEQLVNMNLDNNDTILEEEDEDEEEEDEQEYNNINLMQYHNIPYQQNKNQKIHNKMPHQMQHQMPPDNYLMQQMPPMKYQNKTFKKQSQKKNASSNYFNKIKDPLLIFAIFIILSSKYLTKYIDSTFKLSTDVSDPSIIGLIVRGILAGLLYFIFNKLVNIKN